MKRSLAAVVATALATVLIGASPAHAEELTVSDQQGDSTRNALDILAVTVRNLDKFVVAEVTFEDTTRNSDIIVSVDPRDATGVRMVSEFRATGGTRNYLVRKAFTDRGSPSKHLRCKGLSMREGRNETGPTIILKMPSKCLNGGDYGALRFAVLVERRVDADWAPENSRGGVGSSDWVTRG